MREAAQLHFAGFHYTGNGRDGKLRHWRISKVECSPRPKISDSAILSLVYSLNLEIGE